MTALKELILQDVKTTLEGITTAGGYSIDSPLVTRKTGNALRAPRYPVIYLVEPEEEKEHEGAKQVTTAVMHLRMEAFIWDDRDQSALDATNMLRDMEHRLLQDVRRGGNAIDTTLTGNALVVDEDLKISGVALDVDVLYRHDLTDPAGL